MNQGEPTIDQKIWMVVSLIPSGRVTTYGDVARQAGFPGAARRVGAALRALPPRSLIPWHRVVNARGQLSLPAGSTSRAIQRERLIAEGTPLDGDRIDLNQYRWCP